MVINRLSMPKHVDHLSRSTGVHLAIGRTSSIRSPPSDKARRGSSDLPFPLFSLALSRWTAAAPCLWPSPCDVSFVLVGSQLLDCCSFLLVAITMWCVLRSHWLPAVGLLQLLVCGHHHVMCPSFSLALSRWTAAAPCLWPSPCDTMYPLRTIQNHLVSFSFAKSDMKIKITSEKCLLVLSHRDHPVQNRQLCTPFPWLHPVVLSIKIRPTYLSILELMAGLSVQDGSWGALVVVLFFPLRLCSSWATCLLSLVTFHNLKFQSKLGSLNMSAPGLLTF